MIPVFILTGIEKVFASKAGRWAIVAVIAGIAIFAGIKHYEAKGAAQQRQQQAAYDEAWFSGSIEKVDQLQAEIAPKVAALSQTKEDLRNAQLEIARLSAANDRRPGWDLATVRRLRQLGAAQQRGGGKDLQPAGAQGAAGARR